VKQLFISLRAPRGSAVLRDGRLEELYLPGEGPQNLAGNVYCGRVVRVVPSLNSAFIDIGIGIHAFLHISDVHSTRTAHGESATRRTANHSIASYQAGSGIEDLLHPKQDLLVQIAKAGKENRGPVVTTHVAIPGRFLLLTTAGDSVGVARTITDEEERRRLGAIVGNLSLPSGVGVVFRQSAAGRSQKELETDLSRLLVVWNEIRLKFEQSEGNSPQLLYDDGDMVQRTLRDFYDDSFEKIWVDDEEALRRAEELLKGLSPEPGCGLELYLETDPLFVHFGIEQEIAKLSRREVELPSGGKLVFDQTEALTAIDVQSGAVPLSIDMEKHSLETDLEAASEIARQIRLRNTSGIIVIDFVDLRQGKQRRTLEQSLRHATRLDTGMVKLLPMSEFGLIEMYRRSVQGASGDFRQTRVSRSEAQVFISYRREDSVYQVDRIHEWLARHFGTENVFLDVDTIPAGVDWRQYLEASIERCSVVLVPIGERWLEAIRARQHQERDMVRFEIEVALRRRIPIIPLLVAKNGMPSPADLPPSLRKLVDWNGMQIRPGRDFEPDMNRLIRTLLDIGVREVQ
jgi:Rne/Rng family ribonuclease